MKGSPAMRGALTALGTGQTQLQELPSGGWAWPPVAEAVTRSGKRATGRAPNRCWKEEHMRRERHQLHAGQPAHRDGRPRPALLGGRTLAIRRLKESTLLGGQGAPRCSELRHVSKTLRCPSCLIHLNPLHGPAKDSLRQKKIFVKHPIALQTRPVGDHPRRQRGKSEAGTGSNPQRDSNPCLSLETT